MKRHSFYKLIDILKDPFVKINKVFDKDFFKSRRDLHFLVFYLIIYSLLFFGSKIEILQLDQLPSLVLLIFSWFFSYFINFVREHYYARKGADWDSFDVYAGCYGGLVGAIVYIILNY